MNKHINALDAPWLVFLAHTLAFFIPRDIEVSGLEVGVKDELKEFLNAIESKKADLAAGLLRLPVPLTCFVCNDISVEYFVHSSAGAVQCATSTRLSVQTGGLATVRAVRHLYSYDLLSRACAPERERRDFILKPPRGGRTTSHSPGSPYSLPVDHDHFHCRRGVRRCTCPFVCSTSSHSMAKYTALRSWVMMSV